LLFDLGDTVVGGLQFDGLAGHARHLELADDRKGLSPQQVSDAARALDEELGPIRESSVLEHTAQSHYRLLHARLGLRLRAPYEQVELEFWQAAVRYFPEPGVAEGLAAFASMGLPMAVVSNCPFAGHVLRWELERNGLRKPFAFVLSSADIGLRKPHPLIFTTAARQLGLTPADIWFLGDTLEADVAGARAAGLPAVWYNRRRQPALPGIEPDATVAGWPQYVELVRQALR